MNPFGKEKSMCGPEQVTEKSVEEHIRFVAWSDQVEVQFRSLAWSVLEDDRVSDKEKLEVFRHVRSLGVLPPEATFFLIGRVILAEHEDRRGPQGLDEIEKEMTHAEDHHGVLSKKFRALERKWEVLNRKLELKAYQDFGEPEMARLFAKDEAKFDSLNTAGEDYFCRVYDPENTSEARARRREARQQAPRAEV